MIVEKVSEIIVADDKLITITGGVRFDTIAREWRLKWIADEDKISLIKVQKALQDIISDLRNIDGLVDIQRVVCGECYDYKVITAVQANKFDIWEANAFHPEQIFLSVVSNIPGISAVETQTYTLMTMWSNLEPIESVLSE